MKKFFGSMKDMWDDFRGKTAKNAQKQLDAMQQAELAKQQDYQNQLIDGAKSAAASNSGWAAKYLSQLQNAPNLAFNQGLAGLNRGIADTESAMRKYMAQRGVTGSGMDFSALANSQATRARGISALQGTRAQQQLDNAGQAYNVMSGLNSGNYNQLANAFSFRGGADILNNYMSSLGQKANQPNALNNLVSTVAGAYLTGGLGSMGGMGGGVASAGISPMMANAAQQALGMGAGVQLPAFLLH